MTLSAAILAEPNPNPVFTVDGYTAADPESDLAGDGAHPPFRIFAPGAQDYLPGTYRTRPEAEAVAAALNRAVALERDGRP